MLISKIKYLLFLQLRMFIAIVRKLKTPAVDDRIFFSFAGTEIFEKILTTAASCLAFTL